MLVKIDDEKREQNAKEALEEAARTLAAINNEKQVTKDRFDDLNRRAT